MGSVQSIHNKVRACVYRCMGREGVLFSELSPAFPDEKKRHECSKAIKREGLVWMGRKGLES